MYIGLLTSVGKNMLYVKGAAETALPRCSKVICTN